MTSSVREEKDIGGDGGCGVEVETPLAICFAVSLFLRYWERFGEVVWRILQYLFINVIIISGLIDVNFD